MNTWKTASILDSVSFKASSIICVCIGKEMKPQVRLSTDVYNFTNRTAAFSAQQIKQAPPNTEHKGSVCLCGLASHSVRGSSGLQWYTTIWHELEECWWKWTYWQVSLQVFLWSTGEVRQTETSLQIQGPSSSLKFGKKSNICWRNKFNYIKSILCGSLKKESYKGRSKKVVVELLFQVI